MSDSSNQRVFIASKDSYSSFLFPDGTVQDVPRDAICRSSLLVRALSGADHDNTLRIFVPYGFLRQWLQWLALRSFVEGHPGATRKVTAPQLVGFLQVRSMMIKYTMVCVLLIRDNSLAGSALKGLGCTGDVYCVPLQPIHTTIQLFSLAV